MKHNYQNILIIRTDRIGDVILTTPAFKALRQAFPRSKITLLATPQTRPLVDKNPYLNEILVDDRAQEHKGIMGFWKLITQIREKKFDLAINYHTKRRTNLLCCFAGIPTRLAYRNSSSKSGYLITLPVEDERHAGRKHETDYCLELLEEIGIQSQDKKLHVSLHVPDERWAEEQLRKNSIGPSDKLVAVHLGASDPSKQWPLEYFAEVINQLAQKYETRFVLIGTATLKPLGQALRQKTQASIWDLTGQTSVSQLTSILARCCLLISNDSGPVHIASALHTPVISIFTRNQPGINPIRWGPLSPRSQAVSVPFDPSPDFKKSGSASPEYLHKLKPVAVLEAVDDVFKLC